jgi:hypothetical protein
MRTSSFASRACVYGALLTACSSGGPGGSPDAGASNHPGQDGGPASTTDAGNDESGAGQSDSGPDDGSTLHPVTIQDCNNFPAPGTWQDITPPSLDMAEWCAPYNGSCPQPGTTANGLMGTYGTNAFVLDPSNPGAIYLGTSSLGLWKSSDCGARGRTSILARTPM